MGWIGESSGGAANAAPGRGRLRNVIRIELRIARERGPQDARVLLAMATVAFCQPNGADQ
jgi:hypothetical protein